MEQLFVYGTLLQADNLYGLFMRNNSTVVKTGKLKGKLFDIGKYPGAILYRQSNSYIEGIIVSLKNPEQTFKVLDDYEGYGDNCIQPNEFIRKLVEVKTDSGLEKCWCYEYNLAYQHLPEITSGNYLDYLSKIKIP